MPGGGDRTLGRQVVCATVHDSEVKGFIFMGLFITFEGIEGCGKTTQIKLAGEYLKKRNIPFIRTEEPGGSPLGIEIRKILLNDCSFKICVESEVFLFSAARAQHVKDIILPARKEGKWVLCDRFCDATIAYQGFGTRI